MFPLNISNILQTLIELYADENFPLSPVTDRERDLAKQTHDAFAIASFNENVSICIVEKPVNEAVIDFGDAEEELVSAVGLTVDCLDPLAPSRLRHTRQTTAYFSTVTTLPDAEPNLAESINDGSGSIEHDDVGEDDTDEDTAVTGEDQESEDADYHSDDSDVPVINRPKRKLEDSAEMEEIPCNPRRKHMRVDPADLDYKRKVVEFWKSGLTKQRKKLLRFSYVSKRWARLRSMEMLLRWEKTVARHDQQMEKLRCINEHVGEKIVELGGNCSNEDIRKIGLDYNMEIGLDIFEASDSWVQKMKMDSGLFRLDCPEEDSVREKCDEELLIEEQDEKDAELDAGENVELRQQPVQKKEKGKKRKRRKPLILPSASKLAMTASGDPDTLLEISKKNQDYALLLHHGVSCEYKCRAMDFYHSGEKKKSSKVMMHRFKQIKRREIVNQWNVYVRKHGADWEKLKRIMWVVMEKIRELKQNGMDKITDKKIKEFALEVNEGVGLENFQAKNGWIRNFKALNEGFVPNPKIWPEMITRGDKHRNGQNVGDACLQDLPHEDAALAGEPPLSRLRSRPARVAITGQTSAPKSKQLDAIRDSEYIRSLLDRLSEAINYNMGLCEQCGKTYSNIGSLMRHVLLQHFGMNISEFNRVKCDLESMRIEREKLKNNEPPAPGSSSDTHANLEQSVDGDFLEEDANKSGMSKGHSSSVDSKAESE